MVYVDKHMATAEKKQSTESRVGKDRLLDSVGILGLQGCLKAPVLYRAPLHYP